MMNEQLDKMAAPAAAAVDEIADAHADPDGDLDGGLRRCRTAGAPSPPATGTHGAGWRWRRRP